MAKGETLVSSSDLAVEGARAPQQAPALVLWPAGGWVRDISLVIAGSLFVALMAQVSIQLPGMLVPITGQTFAVALTGAFLGSKRGSLAILTYLAEGALGLPFLAGGASGLLKFAGPTGGYLIGFVFAAFVVGWLCEHGWGQRLGTAALAVLLGDAVTFLFGLTWLARFVPGDQVLTQGLIPFLPGELIKVCLSTLIITGLWGMVKRRRQ